MSKRYDETIDVTPDPVARVPVTFKWRGRRYDVDQQLDSWREGAEWWHAPASRAGRNGSGAREGGRARDLYRVLARPAGSVATGDLDADGFMTPSPQAAVYDLAFDRVRRTWHLARVWD